jgi:ubiquinone/menaquinone biosynthesis C-methylase UbiE
MASKFKQAATNYSDSRIVQQYGVYPLIHKVVTKPEFLKFIGDVTNRRILDFGCGNGHIAFELSRRGAKCIGVDPSARFIEEAHKKYPKLDFRLIRKSRLDGLKSNFFDKVIMSLVLPSLSTKREFRLLFQEASRVLKLNGELVFSALHPLMVRNFKDSFREVKIPASMNYFSSGAKFKNTALLTDDTFMTFTNTHWTLEDISHELTLNGLAIVGIKEAAMPKSKHHEVLANAMHTPYVICFKAKRLVHNRRD